MFCERKGVRFLAPVCLVVTVSLPTERYVPTQALF